MNTTDFLKLLLPESGWIFTATPAPHRGWINTAHQSIDAAVAHVNRLTYGGKAAFFAVATYEQDRVWDASWIDPATKEVKGKWRQRTQQNAQYLRSFFLDLDIDPDDVLKFPSREIALQEYKGFAQRVGLPAPTLVDSGGGFHLYWPLVQAISAADWRATADLFKQICIKEGFRADRSLTSDQARVLRVPGSYNVRRGAAVRVLHKNTPISHEAFRQQLDDYVSTHGINLPMARPAMAGTAPEVAGFADLGDNLGATNDPLNLDRIAFHCPQVGIQVGTRGAATGEQLWRATLGIVKFCEPQDLAYRAVSDGHAEYDEDKTLAKIANWSTGPTTCTHFHQENPKVCEQCPHWQTLTSPAQLGRQVREAPPPKIEVVDEFTGIVATVALPDPPDKYRRRIDGAVIMVIEAEGGLEEHEVVCPYDLYPTRILRQNGGDPAVDERSLWRAHLPKIGPTDIDLPQSLISDGRALYAVLMKKGVYLNVNQAKATQLYMSAYLQKLAAEAEREKLYDHMGWQDGHKEFVLGAQVVSADGQIRPHVPSRAIRSVTKEGVRPAGALDAWVQTMQFFNAPEMEGSRMFLYASFGAPLFHMNDTGNKGVMINANGRSGRGKTTTLKACASIWGDPDSLIVNGNRDGSTTNALYEALGTYHSLPFFWDDITERDADEKRRVLLNISQGEGKMRMKDTGGMSERQVRWATMILASANTDDLSSIMSSGKDVDPHLMRLISVEFGLIDAGPAAKQRADDFLRAIKQNNGHAGVTYIKGVAENYEGIRRGYIKAIAKIDHMLNSANASAERYWTAAVAACYVGAQVAQRCGLLPGFPIEQDLQWMVSHLVRQRQQIAESSQSPLELFAEFLEVNISSTLVVSAKAASNIDNVVVKPHGALLIRHELDRQEMWVSRAALMEFCTNAKTAFRKMEQDLETAGVILNRNALKVLGADTSYAKGQTRSWRIDATKLGPLPAALTMVVNNATGTGKP